MPTVTVKMSDKQFALLERMAKERRVPKAQVLRESFERASGSAKPGTVYEAISHLIGTMDGPGDLSTNPKYMKGYGLDGPKRREFWAKIKKEQKARSKKAA